MTPAQFAQFKKDNPPYLAVTNNGKVILSINSVHELAVFRLGFLTGIAPLKEAS